MNATIQVRQTGTSQSKMFGDVHQGDGTARILHNATASSITARSGYGRHQVVIEL
jgi:hypothetical protein